MRVKAIKKYYDLFDERYIEAGEVLEVADARATILLNARVAEALPTPTPKKPKKKVVKND